MEDESLIIYDMRVLRIELNAAFLFQIQSKCQV